MPRPKSPRSKIGAESSPESIQVGKNIDAARKAAGMNWKTLAARLDELGHYVNAESLSRLPRGYRQVQVRDLMFIGQVLGVAPQDLLVPNTMAIVNEYRLDTVEANHRIKELEAEIAEMRRQHVLDIVEAMRAMVQP